MDNEPRGGVGPALFLAHVVCCGGLVLVATGALGGLGAWPLDSGPAWFGAGGLVVAVPFLWRWRRRGAVSDRPTPNMDAEHDGALASAPTPCRFENAAEARWPGAIKDQRTHTHTDSRERAKVREVPTRSGEGPSIIFNKERDTVGDNR